MTRSPLPASRPAEDLPREAKTTDVNHNTSAHVPAKAAAVAAAAVPSSSSSSVLSSFLYGMPMSSKPHPDVKLDLKAMSFLSLGKDRAEKTAVKESCAGGELSPLPADPGSPGATGNLVFCLFQRRAELASTPTVPRASTSPRGSSSPSCTKSQVSEWTIGVGRIKMLLF